MAVIFPVSILVALKYLFWYCAITGSDGDIIPDFPLNTDTIMVRAISTDDPLQTATIFTEGRKCNTQHQCTKSAVTEKTLLLGMVDIKSLSPYT